MQGIFVTEHTGPSRTVADALAQAFGQRNSLFHYKDRELTEDELLVFAIAPDKSPEKLVVMVLDCVAQDAPELPVPRMARDARCVIAVRTDFSMADDAAEFETVLARLGRARSTGPPVPLQSEHYVVA